jgi:predicted ester cyclase
MRSWLERFNARDWKGALQYYAFPITFNGQVQDADAQLAHLTRFASRFPSNHAELDWAVANRDEAGQGSVLGVRLVLTLTVAAGGKAFLGLPPTGGDTVVRTQDLWLVRFEQGGGGDAGGGLRMREVTFVTDRHAMVSQIVNPPPTLPDISSSTVLQSVTPPAPGKHGLAKVTRGWLGQLANKTCTANAAEYLHDHVYHWSKGRMPRDEFAACIDDQLSVLGPMEMDITMMAVDEEKQRVAVRYVLSTVLVKPMGGMEPNGRTIAAPENVFYQFVNGKILAIWPAIDMMSLEAQMA